MVCIDIYIIARSMGKAMIKENRHTFSRIIKEM